MSKTLIAYGTKYGSTATCAWNLGKALSAEVNIINLQQDQVPNLNRFEQIIIGSPIYVGKIRQEVQSFCRQNVEVLLTKQTGIFICGWSGDNITDKATNLFPLALVDNSLVGYFGGEINLDKLNAIERIVIEKALEEQTRPQILEENITEFVEQLTLQGKS